MSLFGEIVEATGLDRIGEFSYTRTNPNIIQAFIERWHPETNSFHMPFGEMTITLDDVWCLLGLDITRRGVLSQRVEEGMCTYICLNIVVLTTKLNNPYSIAGRYNSEEVAELMDVEEDMVLIDFGMGQSFKMDWLRSMFEPGSAVEDPEEVARCARVYLLYVFGCSLFSDKSGNRVPASWLEFLRDLGQVRSYAWGAAVLAYLYRQLGSASIYKTRQCGGYMTLLEVRWFS